MAGSTTHRLHIERAKSHTVDSPYNSARASLLQARLLYRRHTFEEVKTEALSALGVFEKLGAAEDAEGTIENSSRKWTRCWFHQ